MDFGMFLDLLAEKCPQIEQLALDMRTPQEHLARDTGGPKVDYTPTSPPAAVFPKLNRLRLHRDVVADYSTDVNPFVKAAEWLQDSMIQLEQLTVSGLDIPWLRGFLDNPEPTARSLRAILPHLNHTTLVIDREGVQPDWTMSTERRSRLVALQRTFSASGLGLTISHPVVN